MMTPNEFKTARRKLGLTQAQLGVILDTVPQTIRKWEMGEDCKSARSVNPIAARAVQWMLAGYRPPQWPESVR